MSNKDRSLQLCFEAMVAAAIKGKRCPLNGEDNIRPDWVGILARLGRIKVEISGRNWRTVTILEGEHARKHTQRDPDGYPVWKVINRNGCFINGERWDKAARDRSRYERSVERQARLDAASTDQRKRA